MKRMIVGSLPFSVAERELDHIEYENYWDVTNHTGEKKSPRRKLCIDKHHRCMVCKLYAKCIYIT